MLTRTPVLRIIVLDVSQNVFNLCSWSCFSAYDPGIVVVARCVNNDRKCVDVRILYGAHASFYSICCGGVLTSFVFHVLE